MTYEINVNVNHEIRVGITSTTFVGGLLRAASPGRGRVIIAGYNAPDAESAAVGYFLHTHHDFYTTETARLAQSSK